MIILARAIIITLGNTGIIGKAQEAVEQTNLKNVEAIANVAWTDAYAGGARSEVELQEAVDAAMIANDVDTNKYKADASTTGVEVTIIQNGETLEYAYVYSNGAWEKRTTLDGINSDEITIKLYKTGEKVTPTNIGYLEIMLGGLQQEGDAYKLVVSGSGAFIDGEDADGEDPGYTQEIYSYVMDETEELPAICYATDIIIEEGITSMNSLLLTLIPSAKTIQIPSTVTEIGMILSPAEIVVSSNNNYYTSEDGILYNKEKTNLIVCPTNKSEVDFPASITSIGMHAFGMNKAITNIVIPSSVITIGEEAFLWCENLTTITLPANLENIEGDTFSMCTNLTSITIPEKVKTIGCCAFERCTKLKTINILSTQLTTVEAYAFYNIASESIIYVPNENIKSLFSGDEYNESTTTIEVSE